MTAFFFREGFWRHAISVSRQNIKECDTHVTRKSYIFQPIHRRLWNSWSVSNFVCDTDQTFSQWSVYRFSDRKLILNSLISAVVHLLIGFVQTFLALNTCWFKILAQSCSVKYLKCLLFWLCVHSCKCGPFLMMTHLASILRFLDYLACKCLAVCGISVYVCVTFVSVEGLWFVLLKCFCFVSNGVCNFQS